MIHLFKSFSERRRIRKSLKQEQSFVIGVYKDTSLYLFCLSFRIAANGRKFVEYKGFRIFDNMTDRQYKKVIDKIYRNAKKSKTNDPFEYLDELVSLMRRGDEEILRQYKNSLKVIDDLNFDEIGQKVFDRKSRRLSLSRFIEKYDILRKNNLKGAKFEEIFQRLAGGIKPDNAIPIGKSWRFVDNLKDGVARELKSGRIKLTRSIKKQILKDIDIVERNILRINKIEWHTIEGVDDKVLDFILTELKKRRLSPDDFKVIIYE